MIGAAACVVILSARLRAFVRLLRGRDQGADQFARVLAEAGL